MTKQICLFCGHGEDLEDNKVLCEIDKKKKDLYDGCGNFDYLLEEGDEGFE